MKAVKLPQTRPPMRRMLFIHEQLKHKRYPNCRTLRQDLEVKAVRTILRDIDFMRDQLQLPIEYDEIAHGYFYSHPVDQFPGVTVSESELFALLVARKAISHYRGTPFHRPLRTAFDKLAAGLDPKTVVHLENLGEAMDIRITGPDDLDEETFRVVSRAVHQHRPLRFKYRKHAARTFEQRSIHPYQLVCANHRWYVVGHDLRRDGIRVFVLGRMQGPEILDGVFKRPSDFRIEDYLKGSLGIFKGHDDFEVVIDLDRWGADMMRGRRWHASQVLTELPGGEMRISFHLDSLEEVEPWILSWGAHATVVRPKALIDRIKTTAAGLLGRYRKQEERRGHDGQERLELGG